MQIEDKYKQLQHREHIYKLPDTYIGSVEFTSQECFVLNDEQTAMERRTLEIVPGFFKIFDEILVNAIDHKQRDPTVRNIRVQFERGLSEIVVQNDGNGIDVCVHNDTGLYVPEMLFGHLLTSSNYREDERRTTGGKNGYGATLASIFSQYFIVETVDATRQLKYIQRFSDNNQTIHPPKITKCTTKPYTRVTFLPDYAKFKLTEGITADLYQLLVRRIYDVTAVTPADVSVYLNNTRLRIKSMERYVDLFAPDRKVFYAEFPRWKIGLTLSNREQREYHHMSFVNGIWTSKGGRHVEYILAQLIDRIKSVLGRQPRTKNKVFKTSQIKDNLWLFVDSVIENPSFTSQTKEELTTKVSQFGSVCVVDETWVEKFVKHTHADGDALIERMVETLQQDANKSLKKTDGSKRSVLRGIPKLEDALLAGTKHSLSCTLILTEGDSAKASILSGLSVMGSKFRDTFGVFPLRGKFINVRDVGLDKVSANEEVKHLKTILGLQQGKVYSAETLKELRYGSIALATDQDSDAAHIRGLILNFFHFYWPSLLQIDGFLKSLITPIVKGWYRTHTRVFYTLRDYEHFRRAHAQEKWTYKYYKGLGTSTSAEFKEYFQRLSEITRVYKWDSDEPLKMAFTKSQTAQRKEWLRTYDPDATLEYHNGNQILLTDFVHKDLKHFSNYDNIRSIPSVIDGFKPSQRKVLYGLFKKGKGEIKVAQLASFVSEQTHYHHGEVSLEQTIVGLAQDFVGKNNLPLLEAKGQFGTRLQGGSDHAQSRYIYTEVKPYTPLVFMDVDQGLLTFNEEEGKQIEPRVYYPIVPMVLLSGTVGIGTGYSTSVPTFRPREVVDALLARNHGNPAAFRRVWTPWYRGFKGQIETGSAADKFLSKGVYTHDPLQRRVVITELPIGTWTQPYKEFLEGLLTQGTIAQYIDKSTDETVYFDVQYTKEGLDDPEGLFKLSSKISLANMYLYLENASLHKFESVEEILEYFYQCRIRMYGNRRTQLIERAHQELQAYDEQIRFIQYVLHDPSRVFRRVKSDVRRDLTSLGFHNVDALLGMPIYWWTDEKIRELKECIQAIQDRLRYLETQRPETLWNADLQRLRDQLGADE
jgi:DNA topoisomerase-2